MGYIKGLTIELSGLPDNGIHIFYGETGLPMSGEVAKGGIVKFQRLNEFFPNEPRRFNIFYMVSSKYPPFAEQIRRSARRKGAKFVWNQDGVAYSAWMPSGWEAANIRMAGFLHDADYVFYQSEFARRCADQFLDKRAGPSEVLYNAVDTTLFCPAQRKRFPNELTLLIVGSQYHNYPLESAIKALACIKQIRPQTRIIVAGKVYNHILESARDLIVDLHLKDSIEFLPPFTQKEAVEIYRKSDVLLHTKIQDVCPGVVIEAMACGIPIVYSMSGGVPELVGEEAGVGVITEATWEKRTPPKPEAWAEAVLAVAEKYSFYSQASRQRALERFDLQPWVERHRQVFSELLDDKI
ncbi:glycosyltransferase family 4 protein [Thermodesulfobacteriota bacterium]